MASRLNDLTLKAIEQSVKVDEDLRIDCDKLFHECIMSTIRTGLDRYAKDGRTKINISMNQMYLLNKCNPIVEKVMIDYVKKNPIIEGVKLKPYTEHDFNGTNRIYLHGINSGVTFDWTKPEGMVFSCRR
jgi:hypothetical protein